MIAFNLGDPHSFPFVDPPPSNAIRDGYKLLTELGAIDDKGKLTSHGRIMATLPIDPCIARIILAAQENNCLREIKAIAAALAIPDPRVRPADHEQEADNAHRRFAHPDSDFLSLLNIWDLFHDIESQTKSWSRLKKFCVGHFLSFQRMREWLDLHEQLERLLTHHPEFNDNITPASFTAIHQSLCVGFLRNIAIKQKDKIYLGGGGIELRIFPGSHLAQIQKTESRKQKTDALPDKSHQWIMAASFMETTRLYAMTVAAIDQEWLEALGGTLCKRSWSGPRWHKKSGQVIADEKVTLFGLVIVAGRKINYGRIDPKNQEEARQIFIQAALMGGELEGTFPFLQKNLDLLEKWQATEERLRKRDIVVDDRTLHAFYEQRIPKDVYDRFTLTRFLQRQKGKQILIMAEEDILNRRPEDRELSDFPPLLNVGSLQFRLEYHFSPGAEDDGVTVRISQDLIDTLQEPFFEWLVPGLLREKVSLLLKGLPKNIRKYLIPLSGTVDLLLDDLNMYKGSLHQALERSILKTFCRTITRSDWPTDLPPHLTMRFLLYDQSGKEVATGRSLAQLRERRHQLARNTSEIHLSDQDTKTRKSWEERLFTSWDFAGLPPLLPLLNSQQEMCGSLFSALRPVKDRSGVVVEFMTNQNQAFSQNRDGLNFLCQLQVAEQYKALKKYCTTSLSGPSSTWLIQGFGERSQMVNALLSFILSSLFNTAVGPIPGREEFQEAIDKIKKQDFYNLGRTICDTLMATLRQRREVSAHIRRFGDLAKKSHSFTPERYNEYEKLLDEILPIDFLETKKLTEIQKCSISMKALMLRIERAYVDPAKDEVKSSQLKPHLQNLQGLRKKKQDLSYECLQEMKKYGEMIDQFRISLFAPEIQDGGARVSSKRLDRQWQELCKYY
jgi:ATP-dependent helicase HrpA